MCESSLPARIICNDHELAERLRNLLTSIAPGCEVLSAPRDCSAVPFCRWFDNASLGPAGQVQLALVEAAEVLERTRHSFKSRELGLLRRRLVALLDKLSDKPE